MVLPGFSPQSAASRRGTAWLCRIQHEEFCRRGDWEHRLWGIERPLLVSQMHFPMLNRDGIAISGLRTDGV